MGRWLHRQTGMVMLLVCLLLGLLLFVWRLGSTGLVDETPPLFAASARALAARFDSGAQFVTGSFLPTGYRRLGGDGASETIGDGPSGYLQLGRALDDFDGERFDWALVSGVFNNRREDNLSFFQDNLRALWSRCDRGIAFNLMSTWVDYQDPGLWYARPEDVFAFMKSLTPYVTVRNDYVVKSSPVPFEFAVYAYRLPSWSPACG
jgi:hypothetical protein